MSFFYTELQFRNRSKTVTRRLGWKNLKPGDRVLGVRKAMGLKFGEKQHVLGTIEIVSVRQEQLAAITKDDCAKEGFPHLTPTFFVKMFCEHMKCTPGTTVNRIEFRYVD